MGRLALYLLGIVFVLWFAGGLCEHRAQAQGIGGCICVMDALTEANTGKIAASVTTPALAAFAPSAAAFTAINAQTFNDEFPGWKELDVDSKSVAQANTEHVLATYQAAMQDAHDEVAASAALPHTEAVLAAIQVQTVAIQHLTQVMADLVQIESVEHAEQLNEKARDLATQSKTWDEWAAVANLL